jgi:hypothetical protein
MLFPSVGAFEDHEFAPAETTECPLQNQSDRKREGSEEPKDQENQCASRKAMDDEDVSEAADTATTLALVTLTHNLASPTTSTISEQPSCSGYLSPRDIRPVPPAIRPTTTAKRGRKAGRTVILTSSPYKQLINETVSKEKNRRKLVRISCLGLRPRKKGKNV